MAPETAAHARTKFRLARLIAEAIEAAHLPWEVFTDGMAVQIDADTVYEPDALVRCGPPISDAAVTINDPVIVVEVLSPSTRARDAGAKLADYFRLPSVRHYLIVKTDTRAVIHHRRDDAGRIETRIIDNGRVNLDPPGVALTGIFPA